MKFTVYVLYSKKYSKIYIGYTSNIAARLKSHNELSIKGYTKKFRPWEIVYTEEYDSKAEAMKREKQLKSSSGRHFLKTEILVGLIPVKRRADVSSRQRLI